jgi:hypothetical protein
VLILLTTEPSRLLETILSRCQRVSFGVRPFRVGDEVGRWVTDFARKAAPGSTGVLARYQLLGTLLESLAAAREAIEEQLTATSPLAKYPDATPVQKEQWEDALTAAIEAEYRRRRGEYLSGLQAWLRDVWLRVCGMTGESAFFPTLESATEAVAASSGRPNAAAPKEPEKRRRRRILGGGRRTTRCPGARWAPWPRGSAA